MTEKRVQKRYVEKNNKVFDTWKNIPISRELDRYSLSHIISHLNGLGEIIDTQIKQGRYCIKKYKELEEENEQLKLSSTMYYNLFKELQKQMQGVKSIYDLDSKDFEDLIKLSKGNVFSDEIGWVHLPIKELKE